MTIKGLLRGTALTLVALVTVSTAYDYALDSGMVRPSRPTQVTYPGQIANSIDNSIGSSSSAQPPLVGSLSLKPMVDSLTNNTQSVESAPSTYSSVKALEPEMSGAASQYNVAASPPAPAMLAEEAMRTRSADAMIAMAPPQYTPNSDRFANTTDNPLVNVAASPVSTFSADTDTAGYAAVRRWIQSGQLPPAEAVRTEEMVNYFDYDYAAPTDKARPFSPTVAVYPTPWNAQTRLMHVGIKAFDQPATADRPPVNLVLLIDVSGSMSNDDRLPLAKRSFALMINQLQPSDTVSIVTYAGSSGVALPPTRVSDKSRILSVIDGLSAGGSTAGAEGLATAYALARENYNREGVNRIILATDGDFNVGVSAPGGLAEYVAQQRSSGVFLSVLGFGMGNYQDTTMQAIAQNGNGVAAYIDSISEARRVLSDQLSGTLFTVAKDVKFQVEFNPAQVSAYRLLGYETRTLRREDFDNDKVDAGEVGAGHEVTAIYEIVPVGADMTPVASATVPSLRYQTAPAAETEKAAPAAVAPAPASGELAFLRLRYKLPESDTSTLIERPVTQADMLPSLDQASSDVRFAAAVTGFSRLLRHSDGMSNFSLDNVLSLATAAKGNDADGSRSGFIDLVRNATAIGGLRGNDTRPLPPEDGGVAFPPAQ